MANMSRYGLGLLFFGILACLFIPASAESVSFGYQPDPIQFTETGNSYILNNSELEIEFFKDTLGYNQYRNARNGSVLIYNARTWVDYLGPGDKWKPAGIPQTTSYRQIYKGYEVTRHYEGIQADYDVVYIWIENRQVKHTIYITGKVEDDFQVSEPSDASNEMIKILFSVEGLFLILTVCLTMMGLVAAQHPAGGGAGAVVGVGFGVYFGALPVWMLLLMVIALVVLAGVSVAVYFKGKT